jgi:hypothetical protein
MNSATTETLLRECSYPCISIILPANATDELPRYIHDAEMMMRKVGVPEGTIESITDNAWRAGRTYKMSGDPGLGIFVSTNVATAVSFPFPVNKRMSIDMTFDTEHLIHLEELTAFAEA